VRVYAYVCVCVCVRSQYVLTLIWSAFALRPIANGIRQRPSSTSSISSSAYRHYHDLHFHFQSPFPGPLGPLDPPSPSNQLPPFSKLNLHPISIPSDTKASNCSWANKLTHRRDRNANRK